MSIVFPLLRFAVAAGVVVYVTRQVRKPTRWIGRGFAKLMNQSHSNVTDWGLSHVNIEKAWTILDVGCGGGRTLQKMAAMAPDGRLHGIDYSAGSIAVARQQNAELIAAGRMQIQQGSVSKLPFPDNTFDLVTAVETQYYWPDLTSDMREILRVLKPGAMLLVIAECYDRGRFDAAVLSMRFMMRATVLSVEQERDLFARAGCEDVEVFADSSKGWMSVVGRKPR